MEAEFLPQHLRKYVVEQNYDKYTPVDQAVWRYVLRQLKTFLSKNAHECYAEGLEKTGISVESIPRISDISTKLQKFGWKAMPVSGFIPPAAFMELQSLGVLPVASDMRTLDHLLYTPAPDIVHEAAGHAPILIHPEFSDYLRQYAQVAKKAIISKDDLEVYEAIRELSDIKESPSSTAEDIALAEKKLEDVGQNTSHISEASELSRMNWWTAEYGLIGSLEDPKIFGAGLLSSLGEAKSCLDSKVKKIPLSIACLKTTYDITEPQPQLFVTPNFKYLSTVLDEMAQNMAFRQGGLNGVQKAIDAKSVNTAELSSGLQISGQIDEALVHENEICYLKLSGPTQLCFDDKELTGHNKEYHAHGFGSPVGFISQFPKKCPSSLSESEWQTLGVVKGNNVTLTYTSGVVITGTVESRLIKNEISLILTLSNAKVEFKDKILFAPEWGIFDMALGSKVSSVYGGPADRIAYGETSDFVAKRVPAPQYTAREQERHALYGTVRKIREQDISGFDLEEKLKSVLDLQQKHFSEDWLLILESLELLKVRAKSSSLQVDLENQLQQLSQKDKKMQHLIQDGLTLVNSL